MKCTDYKRLIQGYVDDELALAENLDVEKHVAHCPSCSTELKNLQTLSSALKDPSLRYPLPASLEAKIRRKAGMSRETSFWERFREISRPLSLVAAAVVAAFSFELGSHYSARTGVAQEVIAEHVRSLQAQHLMDVPSTDQHTVKPWFLGKVDFSPKVKDLKEKQFPLVGGRLDYLNGRPVAAIVYKRNAHVINLFTWPEQKENPTLRSESIQGFNLVTWSESGMNYWVVSDLNAAELQQFVELYRK